MFIQISTVVLGMSPTANQSLPSLQLSHGALLSSQPNYQGNEQLLI